MSYWESEPVLYIVNLFWRIFGPILVAASERS